MRMYIPVCTYKTFCMAKFILTTNSEETCQARKKMCALYITGKNNFFIIRNSTI